MIQRPNMDWFRDARWGVFMHFLADQPSSRNAAPLSAADWNRQVEGFDVERLAGQLAEIRAGYFFITLGQNSGFYCSPNAAYDTLVARHPSHCSERDLVADLISTLARYSIPLLVYLPSHAPANDRQAVEALRCTPAWDASKWGLRPGRYLRTTDTDERLSEFQRNWEAIIREWSQRWGRGVAGWWFDGCYHAERMYVHEDEPNFHSFRAAVKAGNADSIVAFNPGVREAFDANTAYEDYTSGEVADFLPAPVSVPWATRWGRTINGAQFHLLTFLGDYWCRGEPRFPDALAVGYTQAVNAAEGVISWDVPHTSDGGIPDPFIRQLAKIGAAARRLDQAGL